MVLKSYNQASRKFIPKTTKEPPLYPTIVLALQLQDSYILFPLEQFLNTPQLTHTRLFENDNTLFTRRKHIQITIVISIAAIGISGHNL